ncbi:MAG: hypothetical protein VKO21_01795 [Candidatus Sericytochromatia bacterium]|nr:hypothetical protein [Candidatus Sericytochromatia bacterium]
MWFLVSLPAPAATAVVAVDPHDFGSQPFLVPGLPPRDPWVAAGLSVAVNGLGQAYNGEWDKAWWLFGAWGLYPLAWALDAGTGSGMARTFVTLGMLGAKGWSAWDGWHVAARQAEETSAGGKR